MSDYKIPKAEFYRIYNKVPRLCVDIIINSDEGILLSKRNISPAKGKWHIPGGTVFFDETLEQAAKRISKEELGLDIELVKTLGIIEYLTKEEIFGRPISIVFLARIVSGVLKLDKQSTEIGFFKNPPENMPIDQRKFLENNLKNL